MAPGGSPSHLHQPVPHDLPILSSVCLSPQNTSRSTSPPPDPASPAHIRISQGHLPTQAMKHLAGLSPAPFLTGQTWLGGSVAQRLQDPHPCDFGEPSMASISKASS